VGCSDGYDSTDSIEAQAKADASEYYNQHKGAGWVPDAGEVYNYAHKKADQLGYKNNGDDAVYASNFASALELLAPGAHKPAAHKPARQLAKDQWIAAVANTGYANRQTLLSSRQLGIKKDILFAAVGNPDSSQTIGENVFLYWECRDGTIQVDCNLGGYGSGIVMGHVNDY
jgi:hypothetical protein